jgi:hypothetical protein
VLDSKTSQFQAIIQLHQLLDALINILEDQAPEPKDEHRNDNFNTSETRKSFDYLDAITNLMVRNAEVAAAVACTSRGLLQGIVSIDSDSLASETPSGENVMVRPQYTLCV